MKTQAGEEEEEEEKRKTLSIALHATSRSGWCWVKNVCECAGENETQIPWGRRCTLLKSINGQQKQLYYSVSLVNWPIFGANIFLSSINRERKRERYLSIHVGVFFSSRQCKVLPWYFFCSLRDHSIEFREKTHLVDWCEAERVVNGKKNFSSNDGG